MLDGEAGIGVERGRAAQFGADIPPVEVAAAPHRGGHAGKALEGMAGKASEGMAAVLVDGA